MSSVVTLLNFAGLVVLFERDCEPFELDKMLPGLPPLPSILKRLSALTALIADGIAMDFYSLLICFKGMIAFEKEEDSFFMLPDESETGAAKVT